MADTLFTGGVLYSPIMFAQKITSLGFKVTLMKHTTNSVINVIRHTAVIASLFGLLACGGGEESKKVEVAISQKTLSIEIQGGGSIADDSGSIQCTSDCNTNVSNDEVIQLTAQATNGYVFQQWNGACSGTGVCEIVMNSDKTVAAVFKDEDGEPDQYSLTVTKTGEGTVTSDFAGIDCGSDCSGSYDENTEVTLTAVAQNGYEFESWGGACVGTGDCAVFMSANRTATATFVQIVVINEYTVSVNVEGEGSVASTPSGLDCENSCEQVYTEGTQIDLVATPESGFVFDGWSGACSGTGNCSFTVNATTSVTANFSEEPIETFTLTVGVSGLGTVTSTPIGITCGSDCTQDFAAQTQVTLQATADEGYTFSLWSGACSGASSCTLTMNSVQTVTAIFEQDEVVNNALTVSVDGNGQVTSDPSGIDCGSDCAEEFAEDTIVSLQATPDDGNSFISWSGACSGDTSCNVTMDAAKSVTALFELDEVATFDLTVTVEGPGRVTSNPSGIDCDTNCSSTYDESTVVSLTAIPDSGFSLDHWEGACSGANVCSVTMDSVQSVTAVFAEEVVSDILLENYSPQGDAFQLGDIPNNASGITWHEGLEQYLVVRNGTGLIYRFDVNFAYLGNIDLNGINQDTEGLAFVSDNEVMVVTEDNYASRITVDEFVTIINARVPTSQQYRVLSRGGSNKGLEGVAVRKATNDTVARVYVCQEGTGGNNMRVAYFDMPADSNEIYDYESNLTVVEPFDADQAFSGDARDLAGMLYDERTDNLIIVSQESRKALQVNPETGAVISTLDLSGAPQFEGVTLGPNNELVFVSEGNWIRIYELD
jgi:uncharacterized protein YjiK/Fe-S cluster biogenesis protein NfuA